MAASAAARHTQYAAFDVSTDAHALGWRRSSLIHRCGQVRPCKHKHQWTPDALRLTALPSECQEIKSRYSHHRCAQRLGASRNPSLSRQYRYQYQAPLADLVNKHRRGAPSTPLSILHSATMALKKRLGLGSLMRKRSCESARHHLCATWY